MSGEDHLYHRLDKIETELGKIADAMIDLAKTQQQMMYMEERMNHHSAAMHEQREDINNIKRKLPMYDKLVEMKDKFTMIILSTILLAVLGLLGFKYFI